MHKPIKAHNVGFLTEKWNISLIPENSGGEDNSDFKIEDVSWDLIKIKDRMSWRQKEYIRQIYLNIKFIDLKTRHTYMLEADVDMFYDFDTDDYGNVGVSYQGMNINDSSVDMFSYADGYTQHDIDDNDPEYEGDITKIINYANEWYVLPVFERELTHE